MKIIILLTFFRVVLCSGLLMVPSLSFSFGTVMTTPEQRVLLDNKRNGLTPVNPESSAYGQPRQETFMALDGLVKRRHGPNTIWVNGEIVQKPDVDGIPIDAGKLANSAVVLKLSNSTPALLIKPGQRVDLIVGKVSENYNDVKSTSSHSANSETGIQVEDVKLKSAEDMESEL